MGNEVKKVGLLLSGVSICAFACNNKDNILLLICMCMVFMYQMRFMK